MKYPRASRALRQAPDPTLKGASFARMTLLHTIGNLHLSRSGAPPLDQILDPPLYLSEPNGGLVRIINIKVEAYDFFILFLLFFSPTIFAHFLLQNPQSAKWQNRTRTNIPTIRVSTLVYVFY